VVGAETQREPDGLAMSSRNRYLDADQRREAVVLSRALRRAQAEAAYGVESALAAARAELQTVPGVDLDYLVVTAPDLGEAPAEGEARILVAAKVGNTRLIDNLPLTVGRPGAH
ncbi:4-phosphopantoate--beta-alanine ligase, partial [Bradyrhizobium sp. NBAIM08]|nr:4-phosphopantoate--beta-alanine ligase [Bradyrhizobium sp. NBAIM08]